jgi:hypothetical protein
MKTKRLAVLSLLLIVLGAGCTTSSAKTTTASPTAAAVPVTKAAPATTATPAVTAAISPPTVATASTTLTTLAFDATKLEPVWRAYSAVHSAIEAGTTYEESGPLVQNLRGELARLSQADLADQESKFVFELKVAFSMYSDSLRTWRLKLESGDPRTDGVFDGLMKEEWEAAEQYGNRAGAILNGDSQH